MNYLENTLRYSSDEELGKAVLLPGDLRRHPTRIDRGDRQSVKSISLDDIREFYAKYYTRENVVIGMGGGYDAAVLEKLEADLGSAAGRGAAAVPAPEPKRPDRVPASPSWKRRPPRPRSAWGFPINVLSGEREWYALAIANSWLGEHRNSSSHLYQVIREERGLNYGDYSYIEHYPRAGS